MLRGVRSRTVDTNNKGGKPLEFPQGFDPAGYSASDIEKFVQQLEQEVQRRQGAEAERTSSLNHQLRQVLSFWLLIIQVSQHMSFFLQVQQAEAQQKEATRQAEVELEEMKEREKKFRELWERSKADWYLINQFHMSTFVSISDFLFRMNQIKALEKERDDLQYKLYSYADMDPMDDMGKMRLNAFKAECDRKLSDLQVNSIY